VVEGLWGLGIETPETIKHLGLHLGQDIERTVHETIKQIDPKDLKCRIFVTHLPPTFFIEPYSSRQHSFQYTIMSSWPFQCT